jgi:exodeoxyribonuclease-3
LKILSWNVNSLKIRSDQLISIIKEYSPHVISLQETKSQDENFPEKIFHNLGYKCIFTGQKTFNGVAIITNLPHRHTQYNLPNFDDPQKRLLSVEIEYEYQNYQIINGYFPNGQSLDSDKFEYKIAWINSLKEYLLKRCDNCLIMGDFNIAPSDLDCHDPDKWKNSILTSDIERKLFHEILDDEFIDAYRYLFPKEPGFTWWDYRMAAFRRNLGLRIDHFLCSSNLQEKIADVQILKDYRKMERPSDHAPILLTMNF